MRLWGPPYPVLQRVIVNLTGGTSFRGVAWERRDGYLVLRNAEMLRAKGEVLPMDGEVAIPLGNVEFVQVLGAG